MYFLSFYWVLCNFSLNGPSALFRVDTNVFAVEKRQHVQNDNNQVTKRWVKRSRRINFSGCGVFSVYKIAEFSKSMLSFRCRGNMRVGFILPVRYFSFFFILCQTILFLASCYSILCNYGVGKSPHLNQYCNSRFFFIISFKSCFKTKNSPAWFYSSN